MDFLRKQRFGVFLARTRVSSGLVLLVFAGGASMRLLQTETVSKAASAVPDEITVLDSRYAKLRPMLPRGQVFCFLAKPGVSPQGAVYGRYSAQYGMAPSLLTPDSNCENFVKLLSKKACVSTRSSETCEPF